MKTNIYIKYSSLFFFTLLALFSFISCEKEIEVDLNSSDPKIVIEALVELDSLATVKITRSQNYNQEGGFPLVDSAIVTISDNVGNVEVLKQNNKGLYTAKTIKGIEGYTYKLDVNVEGKNYASTSTMPKIVKIDSLYMYNVPAIKAVYPMIEFQDIPGEKNYYKTVLLINGKRMKMALDVTDDEDRDGYSISFLQTYDKDYNDDQDIMQGDTITVYLQCIDKGAYTYFESLSRIQGTLNNPTSNIVGGALGYFSAYTSNSRTIIAKW